ncbi:MAG: universal stress protein, partial [Desulfobaccales bacterium]
AILSFLEGAGPVKFLVLGSHGHGFVSRHLIGSVTERVIREVAHRGLQVTVLVVPATEAAEAQAGG